MIRKTWLRISGHLKTFWAGSTIDSGSRGLKPPIVTAVVTRGFPSEEFDEYGPLVARNHALWSQLVSKAPFLFDNVVFHEGNISEEQQRRISALSHPLKLRFVSLDNFFTRFKHEKSEHSKEFCPETELSRRFSLGYRAMCAFWTDEFLDELAEYKIIVRVDDDVQLHRFPLFEIFLLAIGKVGHVSGGGGSRKPDNPDVVRGLEEFVNSWHAEHPETSFPRFDRNPYTNMFALRTSRVSEGTGLREFLRAARRTGCILSNRWGDLPIWGAGLSLYEPVIRPRLRSRISYTHASHHAEVGPRGITGISEVF